MLQRLMLRATEQSWASNSALATIDPEVLVGPIVRENLWAVVLTLHLSSADRRLLSFRIS